MTLECTRRSGANEGQGEVSRKNSAGWERRVRVNEVPPLPPSLYFLLLSLICGALLLG